MCANSASLRGGRYLESVIPRELGMHLGSVSRWISRAGERRLTDEEFADRCEELQRRLGRQS